MAEEQKKKTKHEILIDFLERKLKSLKDRKRSMETMPVMDEYSPRALELIKISERIYELEDDIDMCHLLLKE
ncbi:MAG: hypothetical protein ACPG5P_02120 [Saprospiraceae bacterium]